MPTRSREIRLAARPRGAPVAPGFGLAEVECPIPAIHVTGVLLQSDTVDVRELSLRGVWLKSDT